MDALLFSKAIAATATILTALEALFGGPDVFFDPTRWFANAFLVVVVVVLFNGLGGWFYEER